MAKKQKNPWDNVQINIGDKTININPVVYTTKTVITEQGRLDTVNTFETIPNKQATFNQLKQPKN